MGISSEKYRKIMDGYIQRRIKNSHLKTERREEIFAAVPAYKALEEDIAKSCVDAATEMIRDRDISPDGVQMLLRERLKKIAEKKAKLLSQAGYPADYLDDIYDCPECMDTGFIENKPCKCLEKRITDELYSQSNLGDILERENFSTMNWSLYNETEKAAIEKVVSEAKSFIRGFDDSGNSHGMLFFGSTGAGKTFISNCIAKELLDSGRSVIYFTAFSLFEMLAKYAFRRSEVEDGEDLPGDILDCDLLVIDDLGSESTNSFTISRLFVILNERHLRGKPTIISTNLNLGQIQELYSERCSSRIIADFNIYHFGGRDMRPLMRGYSSLSS